jgi:hypothetical protein
MIIHNLHIPCIAIIPPETDAPLIVYPDAQLSSPVTLKDLYITLYVICKQENRGYQRIRIITLKRLNVANDHVPYSQEEGFVSETKINKKKTVCKQIILREKAGFVTYSFLIYSSQVFLHLLAL